MSWRAVLRRSPRAWTLLGFYLLFTFLTFGAVISAQADGTGELTFYSVGRIALSALAPLSGPFIGAIARDWQSCCAANSWSLLPVAASVLAAACLMQFVPLGTGRGWERLRLSCWIAGWLFWFGSGIFSLGHALE